MSQHINEIIELYCCIWPENKREESSIDKFNGSYPDAIWFLLYLGQDLLGFATVGEGLDFMYGYNVGVHPNYRNRGYGTALMKHITTTFSDRKFQGEIRAQDDRPRLLEFYGRFSTFDTVSQGDNILMKGVPLNCSGLTIMKDE